MKTGLTDALRREYELLYDSCEVPAARQAEVQRIARRIAAARQRYEAVASTLRMPWQVVGVIHALEASLDFRSHLHNGDPLTARTVRVPAGRPPFGSPPYAWETSALDALRLEAFGAWRDWSLPGTLFKCEAYNGWGYRQWHPEVKSPYLWGGSNHYTCGKYVADGRWSATAVSKQIGAAALLRSLNAFVPQPAGLPRPASPQDARP